MKLSEAILLGSTVLAPQAGRQYFSEAQSGCALGMAAIAKGCSFHPVNEPVQPYERRTLGTEGVWGNWVLTVVKRPCDCWRIQVPREMRIKDVIAHLFDFHVARRKNWTLEQLVEWVKTVEPEEPAATAPPKKPAGSENRYRWMTWTPPSDEPSLEEVKDWQMVRQAFTAQQERRRRHRPL